jgi:RNA polymerase sigma factor (TIGR02999 family)
MQWLKVMGMAESNRNPLTVLLAAAAEGDRRASEELLPLVYDELRRLAKSHLSRERPGQTLQPTDLVHEAYLRLIHTPDTSWNGRGHFYGAAALAMRRILIERARGKKRIKHGGELDRVPFEEIELADEPPPDEVLGVADAIQELEAEDPRKGQIVNMRYFAGLSNEETAEALGVSVGTIEREWRFIRAFLRRRLSETEGNY